MADRVDAVEPSVFKIAHVARDRRDVHAFERSAPPKEAIQHDRLVTGRNERFAKNGADISGTTRNENFHD